MPNRVLRDWTDSDRIDSLDVHTERFFTRLIMKVDDYGRYQANVKLLKSHLFPLKSDIRETDITRWLAACEKSGLIVLYNVALKEYLQINEFKQTLRQKTEKYPAPIECDDHAKQMHSIRLADVLPETKRNETNPEVESEGKAGNPAKHTQDEISFFKNFQKYISDSAPNVGKMKEPFKIDEYLKIKKRFSKEQITSMLLKMHNYKPLLAKNNCAYLTFLNWIERDYENEKKEPVFSGLSTAELRANEILNQVN